MSAEDPSIWSKVIEYSVAGVIGLVGLVWADNKRRVDNVEKQVDEKADKKEFERQREHIVELFRDQTDLRKDMNGGFQRITELIHSGQVQILTELAKKADR